PEPVHIDRDMWEKIVFNLLSNAFKFTFRGEVSVTLRCAGERVELIIADSGEGIPPSELPRIFERFHRVRATRSRSYEGTGIGLALVRELVRLHGGEVRVESAEGQGTTFTVSIPTGTAHLPKERISATRILARTEGGASSYVEEALRWLPDNNRVSDELPLSVSPDAAAQTKEGLERPRILIADDNRDMRDYLCRLLASHGFEISAVS